jgi:hypothetical protein
LLAVIIGVLVALGVAQGWFGGDSETVATSTTQDSSTTTSVASSTTNATTATTVPPEAVGDHPLCALYDDLTSATADHLPVEGPEDLETYVTAQIAFHEAAIGVLEPPESEGFTGMLDWYEALADYYEPLGWNPSPGLDVLTANPPPQPDPEAAAATSQTLEERCGVVPTQDTP